MDFCTVDREFDLGSIKVLLSMWKQEIVEDLSESPRKRYWVTPTLKWVVYPGNEDGICLSFGVSVVNILGWEFREGTQSGIMVWLRFLTTAGLDTGLER